MMKRRLWKKFSSLEVITVLKQDLMILGTILSRKTSGNVLETMITLKTKLQELMLHHPERILLHVSIRTKFGFLEVMVDSITRELHLMTFTLLIFKQKIGRRSFQTTKFLEKEEEDILFL